MHRNRVAVMIDGGFFLRRLQYQFPEIDAHDPAEVARLIHGHALRHRYQRTGRDGETGKSVFESYDLYRIFFYDCPPIKKKMHRPVSKTAIDFGRSDQALFREELHHELLKKRKVALRLGHLIETTQWKLKPDALRSLLRKEQKFEELTDDDFAIDTIQKGVDMRLGLDVASLAYKRQVEQIVLIIGDSDFVPAAKMARREGIDVVIDPLGQHLQSDLFEHTDGVRTPSRKPMKKLTPELAETGMPAVVEEEEDAD
jgi:uncharacterized LabA/DUF88 family protein